MIRTCSSCGRKNRVGAADLAGPTRCGACKTDLPPIAEPLEVDAALFDEITAGAKVPVLVDFWAAWCGPCRLVAPEVKKVAAEMAGRALVLKVDTETQPEVASRFGITAIPSFLVFAGGRLVRQHPGFLRADRLREWLDLAREGGLEA